MGLKRDYKNASKEVKNLYKNQRHNQSINFSKYCIKKYCQFERESTFWDLLDMANIKDVSDPDISLENFYHFYQTAEGIRKDGHPEWLQLVGLIHDLGKIVYKKGCRKDGTSIDTMWAIVGDTFLTGHKIPDSVILPEYNILNSDHIKYKTSEYGCYKNKIGLNNVVCSFGHDEYLYRLLKYNNIKLPEEAYYMIRFHSLYLWHEQNEYSHLENDLDTKMKPWVKLFNKYDLYTKVDKKPDIVELKKYYSKIVDKYFPNIIKW